MRFIIFLKLLLVISVVFAFSISVDVIFSGYSNNEEMTLALIVFGTFLFYLLISLLFRVKIKDMFFESGRLKSNTTFPLRLVIPTVLYFNLYTGSIELFAIPYLSYVIVELINLQVVLNIFYNKEK